MRSARRNKKLILVARTRNPTDITEVRHRFVEVFRRVPTRQSPMQLHIPDPAGILSPNDSNCMRRQSTRRRKNISKLMSCKNDVVSVARLSLDTRHAGTMKSWNHRSENRIYAILAVCQSPLCACVCVCCVQFIWINLQTRLIESDLYYDW